MVSCLNYHAERGREALTERHVQAMWYDREMRPESLVTRSGVAVRVVDPGTWNLEAGPDFRNAVLELGAERYRVRGDVEVHLNPADWSHHGHGADPAYRNVVAHVTWGCGPEPASLPPGAVSIWLGRFMTAKVGFSPEQIDLSAYPFARLPSGTRPCEVRLKDDPDLAAEVMATAGAHRLRMKARRLEQILAWNGTSREQVFYEEMMTALGYHRNARGFRWIATTVPYETVCRDPGNAAAAMLAAAGFVDWHRAGLRPFNTPESRLGAAAVLFTERRGMRFSEASDFSDKGCRAIVEELAQGRLMGRGRAAAVLANVILPMALAEGRVRDVPDWLPPEDLSEPVRLTAFRLFGRDHHPLARYADNDVLVQGLIQIHRDYCLQVHPDCDGCRLVENLKGCGDGISG